MRVRCVAALVGFAALGLLGCGDSSTGSSNPALGVWVLTSVNGAPLPFVTSQTGGGKSEIASGGLNLLQNGSYSGTLVIRTTTVDGTVTTNPSLDVGVYTTSGTIVQLYSSKGGNVTEGSVVGGTLTLVIGGTAFAYAR